MTNNNKVHPILPNMSYAVIVSNISKKYKSGSESVLALDDVSISINEGEIFGLLGPNGAGKTSLISILAGILTPDKGDAKILGLDCTREAKKIQNRLNVVSGFTGAPFALSCEEALMYYSLLYNVPNSKQKIDSVIQLTKLQDARNFAVNDLSSGMKQRYLIAKALLNNPQVLILDEPTVGLDVESSIIIREMIKHLRKEGRTILLTTHNMFEAEELCDRIAFINKGKILIVGTVPELKKKIVGKRTVEINCSDGKAVAKALAKTKMVSISTNSPKLVRIEVDDYTRMKEIMSILSKSEVEIFNINALEPTLQETYLKLIKKGDKND